ncbi:ATP synthase subunit 8 (mitochondrion) [Australozyma saopauloensis]|uniref:ATP synthase subunit 8 n=1 Tax=Australozyma saopauloensis TaxID=291208 RepID=A0AAX4HGQ5_9ASCO|nr:ATP synthase subunit 8 [[Candida] saopauloensis]
MPQLTAMYFSHLYWGEVITIMSTMVFMSQMLLPEILMMMMARNMMSKL